jgi:hypothetical protein
MATPERLISSDDYVDISHDQVKRFLTSKFHPDYGQAVERFQTSIKKMCSGQANQRRREQREGNPRELLGNDTETRTTSVSNAQFRRPGLTVPHARLKDMDVDGVDASSTYCEVSAFRCLCMLERGAPDATRAFNTALS